MTEEDFDRTPNASKPEDGTGSTRGSRGRSATGKRANATKRAVPDGWPAHEACDAAIAAEIRKYRNRLRRQRRRFQEILGGGRTWA